ncbi:MAG: hypothetical protein MPW15_09080 [Candidatus Manganitrophus sp.]|nr:hypothetical protein [Candidatus Manganitrophus sp.]
MRDEMTLLDTDKTFRRILTVLLSFYAAVVISRSGEGGIVSFKHVGPDRAAAGAAPGGPSPR